MAKGMNAMTARTNGNKQKGLLKSIVVVGDKH